MNLYSTKHAEKEKINERRVEYKQSMAGMACDQPTAVKLEEQKGKPLQEKHAEDRGEQIRVAAISEYGLAGVVDPRKIAAKLKVPSSEVTAWLDVQSNYLKQEREGTVFYTQKRAGAKA